VHILQPHTQIVVIGSGAEADALWSAANAGFAFNKTVLRLAANEVVAQNLPPSLAETIPNVPGVQTGNAGAVVCSNFTCQPPVSEPEKLTQLLRERTSQPAA
jgi:uncharacterized protein YyaL (SSP411 family)